MHHNSIQELVPVLYGESSVKILHFDHLNSGFECIKMHWHERMELLRVHRGLLKLTIDENYIEATAGDFIIINPFQSHFAVTGEHGAKYDVIMFDLSNLNNNPVTYKKYLSPIVQEQIAFVNKTSSKEVLSVSDDIVNMYFHQTETHPLKIVGTIYTMIGTLYQHCDYTQKKPRIQAEEFSTIIEYINNHFLEPLSCATVSKMFGYNSSYFSRKFKESAGMTFMKYIQTLRLNYAGELLKKTNESIQSVALHSGFSDVHYFSTCFNQLYSMTPSAFRKEHKPN